MSDSETEPKPQMAAPRRRRRWAVWTGGFFLALFMAAALAVVAVMGRELTAPDWLRDEIAVRVNAQLDGAQLAFGAVSVLVERDAIPRILLRNIEISDAAGAPLAVLSDVQGTVALRPLVSGKIQPGTIHLSGATLQLRRSAAGNLGVSVGDQPAAVQEARSFSALIKQMDNVLLQPDLADLRSVEAENLTVRYEDARADQAWTVDGGRLRLTREGDDLQLRGDFALLGNRGFATTLEMNYQGRIGDTASELGLRFEDMPARDIAKQSPALAWLETLDAPISGSLRVRVEEEGVLGPLNATLQIGAGVLQPTEATTPIPFSKAHAYFTYDPVTQSMQVDEMYLDSKWVTARAHGHTYLVGMEQGLPQELWSQIQVTQLSANPAGLYPEPVSIEGAVMDTRLVLDPFSLTLGEMSLRDQGQRLVVEGQLDAAPEGWDLALDARMDGLSPQRLVALWPESVKPPTRNWIRDNVVAADLSDIQLAIRSAPNSRADVFLGFDFDGLETRFMKTMPHIENGRGHGSLYDSRFVITADEGFVTAPQGGRLDVGGTSFVVPTTKVKAAPARVLLKAKGTITAALSMLDNEPFRFLSKANQPVTLADGQVALEGQLDFLLKKKVTPDEVAFDVTAIARNVRNETLVDGRVLAAPELEIKATTNRLEISGEGRVGRVPVRAKWGTDLGLVADGSSTLRGTIELSERFVDEFRIGLPPGSVSGQGTGQIEIDFEKGSPGIFRLSSDLSGLGLRIQALDWALARRATGSLNVSGVLGSPPQINSLSVSGAGLRAEGSVALRADGQLDRARFSRVRVGSWLDAPVDLVGRGANAAPAVQVRGGTIDLRQTSLAGEGNGSNQAARGGPLSLALDRLEISDGIALTDFRADLDMSRGANGSFIARVNGSTRINGAVVPQGGRSAFRIQSQDAGGVMRDAGLLKNARDGQMDLILRPGSGKGFYDGQLTVRQTRLKDAPALAALLNALSVVGILEQMAGDGIHFSEVEAVFQLTPERVTLTQGSAVGASMGISMEGYYFFDRREMDMQGVFSPVYLVNAVGSLFTRRGEGLIGFNYRLNGPPDAPRVRVNPLSLLTPGMFREIFRGDPPEVQR